MKTHAKTGEERMTTFDELPDGAFFEVLSVPGRRLMKTITKPFGNPVAVNEQMQPVLLRLDVPCILLPESEAKDE